MGPTLILRRTTAVPPDLFAIDSLYIKNDDELKEKNDDEFQCKDIFVSKDPEISGVY